MQNSYINYSKVESFIKAALYGNKDNKKATWISKLYRAYFTNTTEFHSSTLNMHKKNVHCIKFNMGPFIGLHHVALYTPCRYVLL